MIKTLIIATLLVFAAHVLPVTQASAQSAKGCFTCESLCRACEKAGLQQARGTCQASCRGWAAKVGLTQIMVRRDLSVCGTSPNAYAPARCN